MTSSACLLLATALAIVACGQLPASPGSTTPSPARVSREEPAPRGEELAASGVAGGAVPDGTTAFDGGVPGVANLDPELLDALRQAAAAAAGEGVTLLVDSGWRSERYQRRLLDEAVRRYGSREAAARWVATPERSAHVSGDAVDVGPSDATAWLADHGAEYGLCQTYGNEPWHYELRPTATDRGCPPMYADPTRDPRMQP